MASIHISWREFWQGNYVGNHWKYILTQLDKSIEDASPQVKNEILQFAPQKVKEHYYKLNYLPNPASIKLPKRKYVYKEMR